jgi:peptidoglycan/LPS O-acetylase OafA/YrhL
MVKYNNPPEIVSGHRRFTELDALRGVAVLTVALFHYSLAYDYHYHIKESGKFYLEYGNFAVYLFFVISGFVIFMTLDKTKKGADFIVSRFSRLYPAYWAAIFMTVIFLKLLPVPTLGNYTVKEIAVNLTMIEQVFKVRFIDQVYWTLKVELTFYILMFVLFLTKYLKKINLICFIWLGLSLISSLVNFPLKRIADAVFILEYAPFFIAGIGFYNLIKNRSNYISHLIIALSFLVNISWLYQGFDPEYNYSPTIAIIIAFCIYGIFYLFVYDHLSVLKNKALVFFGGISYSLYLIHNVIGYSIIYRLRMYINSEWFYIPVTLLITTSMAILLNMLVEKPAMKYIRDKYKKRKEQKAAELVS